MSRSKQTRPDRILAAARVRAPRQPRGKDDQSSLRRLTRVLKEAGIVLEFPNNAAESILLMPHIITRRARSGFIHPAKKSDILHVLQFFGERCFYGLRSIKLIQGSRAIDDGTLCLGRLEVPGTIVLYDQPVPPWFVSGLISTAEREKLERAGALIELSDDNIHCLIHWKDDDLMNFMLFEVLMHEVGHHLIQQYKGKRSARVARTKDHEQFANLFAQRCRESFMVDGISSPNA
jgi:hypothetical protein